jgi:nucleoside-diphosphate-sugar epimerase
VRALVTGAARFIGSTLSDRRVAEGWQFRGIDSLNPYYDHSRKPDNLNVTQRLLEAAQSHPLQRFVYAS